MWQLIRFLKLHILLEYRLYSRVEGHEPVVLIVKTVDEEVRIHQTVFIHVLFHVFLLCQIWPMILRRSYFSGLWCLPVNRCVRKKKAGFRWSHIFWNRGMFCVYGEMHAWVFWHGSRHGPCWTSAFLSSCVRVWNVISNLWSTSWPEELHSRFEASPLVLPSPQTQQPQLWPVLLEPPRTPATWQSPSLPHQRNPCLPKSQRDPKNRKLPCS